MSKEFTIEELAEYKGQKEGIPIYLSIKGVVYDVSSGKDFYGPGAAYSVFAGKDVSRCLGKMEINDKEANCGWTNLNEEHKKTLDEWEAHLKTKYAVVGTLTRDPHFEVRGMSYEP